MKKKLLMALLVGVLAVPSSVSCFAAESTDAAAADSDEEEETEETEAEDKDTTAKKKENLKTVGEKKDGCMICLLLFPIRWNMPRLPKSLCTV